MTNPNRVVDEYDPELHGTMVAPPASKFLAFAVTLALVALPVLFFGLVLR